MTENEMSIVLKKNPLIYERPKGYIKVKYFYAYKVRFRLLAHVLKFKID